MNENPQPPRPQTWLGPTLVALLVAQLGLSWIQGGLLHRQHQDIQGLREDVQGLTESLDQGLTGAPEEEGRLAPARAKRSSRRSRKGERVTYISQEEQPEQQAAKDLEASKQSAQKAVKDAREVQQNLSFEENARKAEEKAKLERAQSAWQKWFWIALGAGLLAIVLRNWLRRRG